MFKLIVNGDRNHELTRSFSWQGEAADYLAALRENGYVETIDLEDRLRGNDVNGRALVSSRNVFTRN